MSACFFRVIARLRAFLRDPRAALTVELVMITPVLVTMLIVFTAFWDGFRVQGAVQRATYSIADMLSREQVPVNATYIAGLERVIEHITRSDARLRVTSLRRVSNGPSGLLGMEVRWSHSPGAALPALTTGTLSTVQSQIPTMAIGASVMMVEVQVPYKPLTSLMKTNMFKETFVLRPRFAPFICFNTVC